MKADDFTQNMASSIYANRYKITPTMGREIAIKFESRKVISAFNCKRMCEVR
jgi:hypothetical protein